MDPSGFSPDGTLSPSSAVTSPTHSMVDGAVVPTTSSATSTLAGPNAPSVQAACLACRSKHLKCDGATPCSRCISGGTTHDCVYIASRRGYKGPRKHLAKHSKKRHASSSPPDSTADSLYQAPTTSMAATTFNPAVVLPDTPTGSPYATASTPGLSHLQLYRSQFANSLGAGDGALATSAPPPPVTSLAERCLESYFHHFWAANPSILPREHLLRLVKDGTTNLDHVLAAMRYVGSLFVDAGPARAAYLDEALRLVQLPTCPRDGFLVQALLLLIVGLDGSCSLQKARELLADCERLALEIGLNTREFAAANGRGSPLLEESWRRTWWDLYVVDAQVAGAHRATSFLLFDIAANVALPCEEHQYIAGEIPTPMCLDDFDDQLFSGEEREFSSFAYRVAAARNLGRLMRCSPILFANDPNLERIENLLTNWRNFLPASKRHDLNKKCQLDEMMFQARFMNWACSMLLHQPHSQLDSSPARSVDSCAPHSVIPHGEAFNEHTRHTIQAASEISRMTTQAVPLLSHTHFFGCVLSVSSIVHLSKWALYFIHDEEELRQQIKLNIGALDKLSEVWPSAAMAKGQVKSVAMDIYRLKKAQQINPAFWVAFTEQEMLASLNADEGIINEFDGIITPVAPVTQPR